jgi:signal transduction histidine kinase
MFDVVETLTKSVSLFTWKAKEKKVNITLKIGRDMPPNVEIDEARVTQVLVNLIGNAVKFTPAQGHVKVRARFIPDENHKE